VEEVKGGQVNCQLPSGLPPGSEGNWWGQLSQPLPEVALKQGASIPAPRILVLYLSAATEAVS
jgi:hypothetical protein